MCMVRSLARSVNTAPAASRRAAAAAPRAAAAHGRHRIGPAQAADAAAAAAAAAAQAAEEAAAARRRLVLRRVRFGTTAVLLVIVAPSLVAYATHREAVPYTGRRRSMLLTPRQERALGERMLGGVALEHALPASDARVVAVAAITRRLAAAAATLTHGAGGGSGDPPSGGAAAAVPSDEWRVYVLDEPTVRNALAAPGGAVVLYTGLLAWVDGEVRAGRLRDREGTLAAVVAHELGHVVARHSAEKVSSLPLAFTLRALLAPMLWLLIPLALELPHTRTLEAEADTLGLVVLTRAGYDSAYAVDFYAASHGTPSWAQWLSSHPSDASRAAAAAVCARGLESTEPPSPRPLQRHAHPAIEAMLTCAASEPHAGAAPGGGDRSGDRGGDRGGSGGGGSGGGG